MTGSLADRFKSGSQKVGNVTEAEGRGKLLWTRSRPLARPHGLCLWQILFSIYPMPQIPNGSSVRMAPLQGLLASFDGFFGRSWDFAL